MRSAERFGSLSPLKKIGSGSCSGLIPNPHGSKSANSPWYSNMPGVPLPLAAKQPAVARGPGPCRPDGSGAALHRCRPGRDSCYFFPLLDFFDFLLFFATQITPPPHSGKSTTC